MTTLHVKRSTWTLLLGLAVAGIVLAVGAMNAKHLQRAADEAQARCDPEAPGKPVPDWALPVPDWAPNTNAIAMLEAENAARTAETACYAKFGRVLSEATINAYHKWPRVAAAIIVILTALPWAWYFLLRRIAELRAAISGNPPTG